MPPFLALSLCAAFVLVLLLVEARTTRGVSLALWIPTIWMLLNGSRPLALWFGVRGTNYSGSAPDRVLLTGLGIVGIFVLTSRRFNWARAFRSQRWLLVLLVYMFLSTLWSDITLVSMKRWGREWVVMVMAFVVTSEVNPPQALATLLRRSAYVLLPFSLVLIKYFPLYGRQYGRWSGLEVWTGVTGQKNQLGRLCMITVFFLGWTLYRHWRERPRTSARYQVWADIFIAALALYLLMGANSSTSWATLLVGISVYTGLHWLRKMKRKVPQMVLLALVIFLIGFGASAPFLGGTNVAVFSANLGRDETLTGRTEVWADVLPAMKQQPVLGYGFGSFWTDARREQYDIPTAHNGYLDILLEIGWVGLALYTLWLLSCARQLHRALAQDYAWASFAICFLLMSLAYNATESALNSLTEYMTAVTVLASLAVSARRELRPASSASSPQSIIAELEDPVAEVNRDDDIDAQTALLPLP